MLLIQQVCEKNNIESDYVKCPSCKRGRLCDKAVGVKISATAIESDHNDWTSARLILKCPKCGNKFIIHISSK